MSEHILTPEQPDAQLQQCQPATPKGIGPVPGRAPLAGCEPRRRGGGRKGPSELATLRQECERLRRECARQQALVRAAQRTVGLAPLPPPPAPTTKGTGAARKRRKQRPKARALKMAARLREEGKTPTADTGSGTTAPAVCPSEATTADRSLRVGCVHDEPRAEAGSILPSRPWSWEGKP